MIPIMVPMLLNGSGDPDRRKRCKECGQVLPKDHGFLKWLTNSFFGILLVILTTVPFVMFFMTTFILWISDGNSLGEDISEHAQHTLVECIWLNLQWVWDLIVHKII